jgi:carnitine 3-dehydrogenase
MIGTAAVKRVAVLGAGTIGGSWVAWFLARGMQVTVWDPRAEAGAMSPTPGRRWPVWA